MKQYTVVAGAVQNTKINRHVRKEQKKKKNATKQNTRTHAHTQKKQVTLLY